MAEPRTRERTEQQPTTTGRTTGSGGGDDDPTRRERQRKRNNDLVTVQEFDGDTDMLRKSGVPEQLIKGQDPDARLIG